MLKKVIKYTNFNGDEVEETFYFNINEVELTELEVSKEGGLRLWFDRAMESNDNKEIVELFKKLLLLAYGEKSPDGKRFVKSPEMALNFEQSAAFPALFMELISDEPTAIAFVNGLLPAKLADKVQNDSKKAG